VCSCIIQERTRQQVQAALLGTDADDEAQRRQEEEAARKVAASKEQQVRCGLQLLVLFQGKYFFEM
jgi:hypothetical protein